MRHRRHLTKRHTCVWANAQPARKKEGLATLIESTHSVYSCSYIQGSNTERASLEIENKARMSNLTTFIWYKHSSGSSSPWQEAREKRPTGWKGRNKGMSICRWHNYLWIENPKKSTNKSLEQMNSARLQNTTSTHKNHLQIYGLQVIKQSLRKFKLKAPYRLGSLQRKLNHPR